MWDSEAPPAGPPSLSHFTLSCHQCSLFSLLVSQRWSRSQPAELNPAGCEGRGCEHHRGDKSPASCLYQCCQAGPVYVLVCRQGLVWQNYFSCLGFAPDQTHYVVKSLINLASSQLHPCNLLLFLQIRIWRTKKTEVSHCLSCPTKAYLSFFSLWQDEGDSPSSVSQSCSLPDFILATGSLFVFHNYLLFCSHQD